MAIPSDVTSSTAAAEPTQAATRGFEALPSKQQASTPDNWGMRNYEPESPSDTERVKDALDALQHVREHHTQDDDGVPPWKRRDTPAVHATIDEVVRLFGHSVSSVAIEERLKQLETDQTHHVSDREDILGRLDTIESEADKLSMPTRSQPRVGKTTIRFPFGRSRDDSRERITDAIETLRDVLSEGETDIDGWGMQAMMEARE